jgi:lipopolysaccharide assembly protein A
MRPWCIVVLAAFVPGCVIGVLAMVPGWWRHWRAARRVAPPSEVAAATGDAATGGACR